MVARMGAWSTVHNWGLGGLADDVGLVVGELGTNAWMQGHPPIVLTLRLEAGCLTIEVSDTGPGMPMFSNPSMLGMQAAASPLPPRSTTRSASWLTPRARRCGHGCASAWLDPPRATPEPQPPDRWLGEREQRLAPGRKNLDPSASAPTASDVTWAIEKAKEASVGSEGVAGGMAAGAVRPATWQRKPEQRAVCDRAVEDAGS